MKKALIMNDIVYGGGVEKVMYDVVQRLIQDGYKVTVLTIDKGDEFKEIYPDSVKYLWLKDYEVYNVYGVKRLIRRIRFKINCVWKRLKLNLSFFNVVISIKEGQCMSFISKIFTSNNKVGWIHLDYEQMHWTKEVFKNTEQEYRCMLKFRKIICVSNQVRESVCKVIGDSGNLIVKYNPMDVQNILNKSKEKLTDYKRKEGTQLWVSVGRAVYQKGYDRLIEAVYKLKKYEDKVEIIVIGDGEKLEEYRTLVKEKGIRNLNFLGNKENPYKYLKLADWFISTSRTEGYSLVSQEAAVLDVPIIATNCSGVPELLGENSEYGIIVKNDVDSIYSGLLQILQNGEMQGYYKRKISERKKIITYEERLDDIMKVLKKES